MPISGHCAGSTASAVTPCAPGCWRSCATWRGGRYRVRRRTTNNVIPIEAAYARDDEDERGPMNIPSDEPSAETRMIEAGDRTLADPGPGRGHAVVPGGAGAAGDRGDVLRRNRHRAWRATGYGDVAAVPRAGGIADALTKIWIGRLANMRCDEVQDLASAWLDNELSEAQRRGGRRTRGALRGLPRLRVRFEGLGGPDGRIGT